MDLLPRLINNFCVFIFFIVSVQSQSKMCYDTFSKVCLYRSVMQLITHVCGIFRNFTPSSLNTKFGLRLYTSE